MKHLIGQWLIFAVVPCLLLAQSGHDDCSLCLCLTDPSCAEVECNAISTLDDCANSVFSPPCDGIYFLTLQLRGAESTAAEDPGCAFAVLVRNSDGTAFGSVHSPCVPGQDGSLSPVAMVLKATDQYTLSVCLRACGGTYTCSAVDKSAFEARAWLTNMANPCTEPPCK